MVQVEVTLRLNDSVVTIVYEDEADTFAEVIDDWREGILSCDCNRSRLWGWATDDERPPLPCGQTVQLVSIQPYRVH